MKQVCQLVWWYVMYICTSRVVPSTKEGFETNSTPYTNMKEAYLDSKGGGSCVMDPTVRSADCCKLGRGARGGWLLAWQRAKAEKILFPGRIKPFYRTPLI